MSARELIFDEASHTYSVRGAPVPGVTTILAPLVNFDGVPPDVLEAKRRLGSDVHFACQLHDEHDLDEDSVTEEVAPYLQGYRRFLSDSGAVVLVNERRVFHLGLRYAGTLDRVMSIYGARWLVDIKTSIATPLSVGPQTAGYMHALDDGSVTHRGALRLRPDGSYRLDALTNPNDLAVFMACLTLHRFKESAQ